MKGKNRRFVRIVAIIAIIGLIGGYAFYFLGLTSVGKKNVGIEEVPNEKTSEEPQKIDELTNKLLRIDDRSDVQVGVMLINPIEDNGEYYVFKTMFNSHSINLDPYDFSNMAVLITSDGMEIKDEVIWEKIDGEEHHYLGNYKIPKKIKGKAVVDKATGSLTLRIMNLDGIEKRDFTWESDITDLLDK